LKKNVLIVCAGILFVVMLVALLGSSAFKSKTAAAVKVVEVSNDFIVVENQLSVKTTINVPKSITKLIKVNEEYFVEYEYSFIESPKLVSIEPLNESVIKQ